jgi:hypothetical protein
MRESGVTAVLIYCSDFRCSHWIELAGLDEAQLTRPIGKQADALPPEMSPSLPVAVSSRFMVTWYYAYEHG